ncbi:MAG: hypothetical protein J6T32_02500, partial [Paludibacteraceae bacterium]|nr:hypothetical protein [Paludibacteraceae bacterium]
PKQFLLETVETLETLKLSQLSQESHAFFCLVITFFVVLAQALLVIGYMFVSGYRSFFPPFP